MPGSGLSGFHLRLLNSSELSPEIWSESWRCLPSSSQHGYQLLPGLVLPYAQSASGMCRQCVDTFRSSFCGRTRDEVASLNQVPVISLAELGHASSLHQCLPSAWADWLPLSYLNGDKGQGASESWGPDDKVPKSALSKVPNRYPHAQFSPCLVCWRRVCQLPSPTPSSSATKPATTSILHSELYPGIKPSYTSPRLWHTLNKETNTSTFLKENHKCLMWLAFLLNQVKSLAQFLHLRTWTK